jgi:hypothetical protein
VGKKRILILVRTYPTPARKSIETSCTGGITEDGKWIRLFPMPYRDLKRDQRFSKYQWIEARIQKAKNDGRVESFNPDRDSIMPVSEPLPTDDEWRARKELIFPLKSESLCAIRRKRDFDGEPTLGIFKPAIIESLEIEADSPDWTREQQAILKQRSLFETEPKEILEKILYSFRYKFRCSDPECKGHKLICTDWEMGELYRKVRQSHGDKWEAPFRQRYETDMIGRFDTHFYVGTLHLFPDTWIIVGVFYPLLPRPPKQEKQQSFKF